MSIISNIVNHSNSLIQSRTISVDLTSYILRKQLSTTYWRDAVWDLLTGHTYIDAVTQCWQTLTLHKLKYYIRGCSSPNFAKNCIKSTIHGLLSMTKGAGKCSWWPVINPEVSNVVTPGQFTINVDILLHITLKRAPKRIHEDFFGLTRISSHSNSVSHILRIRWREVTDGATNRMSSAYKNILIYVIFT